jgi:hypothetical protein
MIEINLLPEQLRGRTQATAKRTPMLAPVPNAFPIGLVGLTLLMGLLIVVSSTRVGSSQRRVRQIEHELKQAKTQAAEAEQVTAELPTVEARYQVLADRLDGKIAWAELLRVISLHCPTNQPGRLVIAGAYEGTSSLEMLFADGLKESATFAEVFEAVIPEKNLEPDGRTSFALFCSFRPRADQLSTGVLSPAATEKGTTP